MTPVSIIIPAWNLWHLTLQCLESIAIALTADALHGKVEIIVVNNGSTDETNEELSHALARLFGEHGKELHLAENMGFAKGCNAGARAAKHPLLFFLNNDTIVTKGFLPLLVNALEADTTLGIVGPLLLYPNSTVQHCGVVFSPTLNPLHLYKFYPYNHPLVQKKRLLQAITAAACLISAALFFECGAFHEDYVNGYEDLDLCAQIHQRNLYAQCVPQSIVYHLTSQSPGRFDYDEANIILRNKRMTTPPTPDYHTIIQHDNLHLRIGELLQCIVSIPHAQEDILTAHLKTNFDESLCLALIEKEPLCFKAYDILLAYYTKQARWNDALRTCKHRLIFAPTHNSIQTAINMALKANDYDASRTLKSQANFIKAQTQKHLPEYIFKLKHALKWATERHDVSLQKICLTALKHYGYNP